MKITVMENERGFLFKNGNFQKMLMPGNYQVFGQTTVRKAKLNVALHSTFDKAMLSIFRNDPDFAAQTFEADVPDGSVAAHMADGHFVCAEPPGHYVHWNVGVQHTYQCFSMESPETDGVPAYLCEEFCKSGYMQCLNVPYFQQGFLLFNGELQRTLPSGKHFFWKSPGIEVTMHHFETRRMELELNGQEILTKDRVGIRLNCICHYQYTDARKAFESTRFCDDQFRTVMQLGLREYIAGLTLDELLNSRDTIGEALLAHLQPKAEPMFIEVLDAGVRDIILPGEIRDIMNTVLLAEKRAQANVITRREEVASTRSLLNTAKLMDENQTLYKLKELEYLERICEHVGTLSVSGGDVLAQLRGLLGGQER